MRKAVTILGLALMAVGLTLTAFGTQQVPISGWVSMSCNPSNCVIQGLTTPVPVCEAGTPCYFTVTPISTSTQPSFTINYVGMFLAVLGSVFFATSYPKRPSSSFPANAISLN